MGGDIVNMAETLQDVVRRLERIEARLEHNQIGQQAQDVNPLPKPPRTRRPPDAYLQEETTNGAVRFGVNPAHRRLRISDPIARNRQ